MAFIANTAFEIKVSNHEFDSIANITGVYNNSSAATEACSAGFLCTKTTQTENEGYTGINNLNDWIMVEAESTDVISTPIYACNTFNVNEVVDPVTGAIRKVGNNTLGLPLPKGKPGTFTQIVFNGVNIYRFGIGNLSAAISTNTYFTIANGLLVPAAAAPTGTAGQPYFELVGTGAFTQGAYTDATNWVYYDVLATYAIA